MNTPSETVGGITERLNPPPFWDDSPAGYVEPVIGPRFARTRWLTRPTIFRLLPHPVQRAELVAVGIAQVRNVQLHAAAFADTRRVLAGGAALGETGGMKG